MAHFTKLYIEKREDLEDQQRHLNIGLDKLRDTVEQVGELRGELASKERDLATKDQEAKAKLKEMVSEQQEAEAKKLASIHIQAELEKQATLIRERQDQVQNELADVEPAVRAAAIAVTGIKKQQLAELVSLRIPPPAIVGAAEACVAILGHQNIKQWPQVLAMIRRDDFAYSVQHFDTSTLDPNTRKRIERDYLNRPDLTIDAVHRANKAMTPLLQWVLAQLDYANILERIGPLRQEVAQLEYQESTGRAQAKVVQENIAGLEESIARIEIEYASLISETQAIKSEMQKVKEKVNRSARLLDSLSAEETRWAADSQDFASEMENLAGNVLLSAAFLTYCGYFDQRHRDFMKKGMIKYLADAGIAFKPTLALTEYLSSFDARASWTTSGLPTDSLAAENAIMIQRYNRFPLLVDPTGQAVDFLRNQYRSQKIAISSFMDVSFIKSLESAVRFGSPILIQDAERLDPILNPILNREVRRTGGRNLVRIGNQDIDLSPAFTMFLASRDPSIAIPPDLSSRTTVINFTMTPGSLESQSLDRLLRSERPDTDSRRQDLLKAQGEYRLRLRSLEKRLLLALNESTGSILENEKLIATLESLKSEAAAISEKMQQTVSIADEIERVTQDYRAIAQSASAIYFLLERLSALHHFYRFSLKFFMELFDDVLTRNPKLKGIRDPLARRDIIVESLFLLTFERVSQTLIQDDHTVLALALAQLAGHSAEIRSASTVLQRITAPANLDNGSGSALLDTAERQRLLTLTGSTPEMCAELCENEAAWTALLHEPYAETAVPVVKPFEDSKMKS